MKHFLLSLLIVCFSVNTWAQETVEPKGETFEFTTVKEIPITSVKNQSSSSTCWSFSGLALVEAELLRMGKGDYDLSAMYVVHKNYQEKAEKFIRMHGATNFSAGGSFDDVLQCIKDHGIVPMTAQPGLNYGEDIHKHNELDRGLRAYMDAIVKNPNRKLTTAWQRAVGGILDAYLGECPEEFVYNGAKYTPKSFAASLGFNPDDYVSITSYTHHPFYTSFPIEIPDNWRWAESYNVPMNEMMDIIDRAMDKGYTVAWAADVSERGFSRQGVATIPDLDVPEGPGSDQAHWLGLTQKEREEKIYGATGPVKEKTITQEMRQVAYDNYETTDDHGMLIYGTAKDQKGNPYYMIKNSWGTENPYKGTWYISRPFVEYKTMSIVVHKDVLPDNLKKKLRL